MRIVDVSQNHGNIDRIIDAKASRCGEIEEGKNIDMWLNVVENIKFAESVRYLWCVRADRPTNPYYQKPNNNEETEYDRSLGSFLQLFLLSYPFCLKYSPRTDLTVSGIVSSFRDFLSWSKAFTISSLMLTMIFCITTLNTLPLDTNNNPNIGIGIYHMVGNGIRQPQQNLDSRKGERFA